MTPLRPTAPTARAAFLAAIVADITDRRGLKHEWNAIDDDVQAEILATWDGLLTPLVAAVRAEALASERERCALELDELAQEADMAAYACLGGATADTEPGEVLDGEGLSIAAATACAYRDGAARIRAMVSK